jgi:hypothetical protein
MELEFVSVCVCAHAHVCSDAHVFQITAGVETDNQEGRASSLSTLL